MKSDVILIPAMLFFWGWVLWFVLTTVRRHKSARLQADSRNRLLDKIGSSPELLAYLQTDAGRQLVDMGPGEQQTPFGRIVGALEISAVLLAFGTALLSLHWLAPDEGQPFLVFGVLVLSLGAGFALSAAVSYVASKSFGLLNGNAGRHG